MSGLPCHDCKPETVRRKRADEGAWHKTTLSSRAKRRTYEFESAPMHRSFASLRMTVSIYAANLRDTTLARRPLQRAPANQVHMQMENRLARARAHVQHRAVAIFNRPLPGNVRGRQVTASHQLRVFRRRFLQASNMFFREDQHVGRALGVQIFKGKRVLVFIDFLGWHFAANDTAE